jgi:hypothetical protein
MNENQQPKITGPSNSRFRSREREPLTQISFDRMTVIGDLNPRHIKEFRSFIASNPYVSVLDTKTDYVRAKMYDDLFYLEYDKIKGQSRQRRNMRIEFNPNHCSEDARDFFVKHIVRLMNDVGFSRLDLALDMEKDLSSFYVASESRWKSTVFYGLDDKPETKYFGVRDSQRYIRLYDKKRERKHNAEEEITAADLWRLEFELKRDMVNQWETVADDLTIKEPDWHDTADIQQRAMVYLLMNDKDSWNDLGKTTKAKYRKIIREMEGENITGFIQQAIKNEAPRLRQQLEDWTGNKLI